MAETKTLEDLAGDVVDIVLSYQGAGIGGPHVAVRAAIESAGWVSPETHHAALRRLDRSAVEAEQTRIGMEGARGNHDRARRALVKRAKAAETKLADPWDLEGNAAAMAWKKRVDAVQAWAEQEYGDASAFPTGLVFALFGSVAAELHEVGASDDGS